MKHTEMEIGLEDIGLCLEIHGSPQRYRPARTQGDPDDCHPAEGGDCDDLTVYLMKGDGKGPHKHLDITNFLSGATQNELNGKLYEYAADLEKGAYEDAMEARYEATRSRA